MLLLRMRTIVFQKSHLRMKSTIMKITFMSKKSNWIARFFLIVQACLFSSLFFPSIAYAYVDPGSGGVIVTTILGLIAAIGYTFRKYFYKIKKMISGEKTEEDAKDDE